VASKALCALSDWLFGELGLHRIELMHSTLNPTSCRVAELASFQLEGVKRQEALLPDGWHDMHLHARLADEPDAAAASSCSWPAAECRSDHFEEPLQTSAVTDASERVARLS
jgi:hypothetical protein